jgi:hypothetical protein
MDAVTLYVITHLANGEMKTRAMPFPSLEKCERLAAQAPDHGSLIWCRESKPIVIAR